MSLADVCLHLTDQSGVLWPVTPSVQGSWDVRETYVASIEKVNKGERLEVGLASGHTHSTFQGHRVRCVQVALQTTEAAFLFYFMRKPPEVV